MKTTAFKRIIALALVFVMVTVMLPTVASAQSGEGQAAARTQLNEGHTVENDGVTYNLPRLPIVSGDYILLKNTDSKDVLLLVGVGGYFGSDTSKIVYYNIDYKMTNCNPYVSTFNGAGYDYWTAIPGEPSFSLSGYEILYKSTDIYPIRNDQVFTTLPEGVTWDDKIIISYSSGAYRLYKPANNLGVWVDSNNKNNNFVYRDTLTSTNQTLIRYMYDTNTRTWTRGTYARTEGASSDIFYIGSDVYLTDGTVKRVGQRDFYAQSSRTHMEDLIYDLPSILTSNSYILLRNTTSQYLVLLIGEDDGYFGCDGKQIYNYDSSYAMTSFTSAYVSAFDGTEYKGWVSNDIYQGFSLSGYEILYKSKDIYPRSSSILITTLPEGVTWEDKIIMTCSSGVHRVYKPENNQGVWVDVKNKDCDFVYRDTLTSEDQTLARYMYNSRNRSWIKQTTFGRTEGTASEVFYVGSDVFSTDGTVKRVGQHELYAQSSKKIGLLFEPLEPSEAKEFLNFISNVKDGDPRVDIEKELPQCYALLTGAIEDPEEELEAKILFLSYFYICLNTQLAQSEQKIELGTTYLIKWADKHLDVVEDIYEQIREELWEYLKHTIALDADISLIDMGSYDFVTDVIKYSDKLAISVGTILEIRRKDDIEYLKAYLNMLEAEYKNDQYHAMQWKLTCESLLIDEQFGGHPQEMEKYAEYIFSIEHSISN